MGSKPSKISASRGASILGLNDWQSQFEIWQIIREELEPGFNAHHGYTLPPPTDNAAIRWGTAFEDAVVSLSASSRNQQIYDREKFYENGIMTCHIDGIYTDGTLHEGKTTSIMAYREKWSENYTDGIPINYKVQVQHQMHCTGAEKNIVSVLVFPKTPDEWESMGWIVEPHRETGNYVMYHPEMGAVHPVDLACYLNYMGFFHQYTIERSENDINTLIECYNDFWNEFILKDNEPEIDRYDDIKRAFPEPKGTIVAESEELDMLLRVYRSEKEELSLSPLYKNDKGEPVYSEYGSKMMANEKRRTRILEIARKLDPPIDDDSREKTIFMSRDGKKLASYYRTKTGSYVFR